MKAILCAALMAVVATPVFAENVIIHPKNVACETPEKAVRMVRGLEAGRNIVVPGCYRTTERANVEAIPGEIYEMGELSIQAFQYYSAEFDEVLWGLRIYVAPTMQAPTGEPA